MLALPEISRLCWCAFPLSQMRIVTTCVRPHRLLNPRSDPQIHANYYATTDMLAKVAYYSYQVRSPSHVPVSPSPHLHIAALSRALPLYQS